MNQPADERGTVTILGAGAMGSALATPFRQAGWSVRLWGTWLDDHLLAACRAGLPHPRTKVPLASGTELFDHPDLLAALNGAELVVIAVASVGVEEVVRRAAPGLADARAVLLTSKGFAPDEQGRIELLPAAARRVAAAQGVQLPPIVAVGGPCKANEVAAGRATAAVFAAENASLAKDIARSVATAGYRAQPMGDECGVEMCAPMKNVYAIALGIADGLGDQGGEPWHDLKAAAFARAVQEMIELSALVGGRADTAYGLAGVGDLEVTALSGRNSVYGARIGRGEGAAQALEEMAAAEQTVEGVPAAELAAILVDQRAPGLWPRLPLLAAVRDIIRGAADPQARLIAAALPSR
ncbi:MAG TPA: 2-dehydropantoate 2-reductase N-terminal domain-containing protein [Nakamurella sp.]